MWVDESGGRTFNQLVQSVSVATGQPGDYFAFWRPQPGQSALIR